MDYLKMSPEEIIKQIPTAGGGDNKHILTTMVAFHLVREVEGVIHKTRDELVNQTLQLSKSIDDFNRSMESSSKTLNLYTKVLAGATIALVFVTLVDIFMK